VDKRKAWREQEQQLIEMWNSAARRYREIVSLGGSDVESTSKAAAVRAEIEALRKKVARLKSEFNSGKRY
jgi:polyhydroxyalkanoate synthesis regulator phasin